MDLTCYCLSCVEKFYQDHQLSMKPVFMLAAPILTKTPPTDGRVGREKSFLTFTQKLLSSEQ